MDNGSVEFSTRSMNTPSGTILATPDTYADGQWHHVTAYLSDSDYMMLYVDGVLQAQGQGQTIDHRHDVRLGDGWAFPSHAYTGSLDNVRILQGLTFDSTSLTSALGVSGQNAGDDLGWDVASVGNNFMVSAPRVASGSYTNSGEVYLYDGDTGALLHTFANPTPASSDYFGQAIGAVGNYILIGAPGDSDANGLNNGAVYVYDATTYALLNTLITPNNTYNGQDLFGSAIATSGSLALIGADGKDTAVGNSVGEAYLFDLSASTGTLLQTFANPDPHPGDRFGQAVGFAGDNAIVGAPYVTESSIANAGAAYLFDAGGSLLHTFVDPNPISSQAFFGAAVAGVGNNVVVGANQDSTHGPGAGAVFLFDSSNSWQATEFHSPVGGGLFGYSLAVDGTTLAVGARSDKLGYTADQGTGAGAVYLYEADTASATFGSLVGAVQQPTPVSQSHFGFSVAFRGHDLIAGATLADGTGAAYLYQANSTLGLSASNVSQALFPGQSVMLSGSIADPGSQDTHTVVIDWGDGTANTTLNLAAGVLVFSATHEYADDNPTGTPSDVNNITATVTDSAGDTATASRNITVNDIAPVFDGGLTPGSSSLNAGESTTLSGTFSQGHTGNLSTRRDSFTVDIDWGDGSAHTILTYPANSVGGSQAFTSPAHTYWFAGTFTVTATVTDDDTGSATATTSVLVSGNAFEVSNTADSGFGSLRQVLTNANNHAGTDTVTFNIAGSGVQTITPGSALPTITEAAIIDGTTEPGFVSAPVIEIRGDSAGAGASGLTITSSGSTVRGLVINRFDGNGIFIDGSGVTGNTIEGNYIGTDSTGTAALGNQSSGVTVTGNSNLIGGNQRNVISGNVGQGIYVTGSNNQVFGNFIGTTADGLGALGNTFEGVKIHGAGNVIGGTTASARNIISGNGIVGVQIEDVGFPGSGQNNVVQGNYIGTDVNGTTALGLQVGIAIGAANNTIGGSLSGSGNLVSGNAGYGIAISGTASFGNRVQGNYIGTDSNGSAALGNAGDGVLVFSGAHANYIGTDGDGTGDALEVNVISANNIGIELYGSGTDGNVVAGNLIGTNAAGTGDLGNTLDGVKIDHAAGSSRIGTDGDGVSDAEERNVISGNNGEGVDVEGFGGMIAGVTIAGNYIGTDITGTQDLGNSSRGIYVANSTSGVVIGTDGSNDGFNASERNVISGNDGGGIQLSTSNVVIAGNSIGVDVNGTPLLNNGDVVRVFGSGYRIGTNADGIADALEGNIIRNSGFNSLVLETGSSSITVAGNDLGDIRISGSGNTIGGTTAGEANTIGNLQLVNTGSAVYGNDIASLQIPSGATQNIVGGPNPGERNIIQTANIAGDDNTIQGNYFATNAAGTAGTGPNANIVIISGNSNQFGGTAAGEGNLVSPGGDSLSTLQIALSISGDSNVLEGNLIGTNFDGTAVIGSGRAAVQVTGDSNRIGGSAPARGTDRRCLRESARYRHRHRCQ